MASRAERHGSGGSGAQANSDDNAPVILFGRWCKHGHDVGTGSTPGHSGKPGVVRGGRAMEVSGGEEGRQRGCSTVAPRSNGNGETMADAREHMVMHKNWQGPHRRGRLGRGSAAATVSGRWLGRQQGFEGTWSDGRGSRCSPFVGESNNRAGAAQRESRWRFSTGLIAMGKRQGMNAHS